MARTTVNIADRGVDTSGTRPINDVLAATHGNDREIHFPPGRYRLHPITLSGSNWALRGDDATLVVPSSVDRGWLSASGADWKIDGFTVDLRAHGAAPSTYLQGTDWTFSDVAFRGQMSDPEYGQPGEDGGLLYPAVTGPDATGLIENVEMVDGSAELGEASNRTGIWFGENNRGHLHLRGLRMEKWAHNTLYGEASVGPVTIEDSVFRRTNVGVRVGGDSVVRNCVFVQDDGVPVQLWSGGACGRGLWLNNNRYYPGSILVENCDFTMTGEGAGDAIVNNHSVEHLTVRNCTFEVAGDRKAIDLARGDNRVSIDGVDVTGEATPVIDVAGSGSATDVCTSSGYEDVRGIAATNVQQSDCLPPRRNLDRGLDDEFAHLSIDSKPGPNYEFVVEGTVRPGPEADLADVITRREDGTTTVAGFVEHGDVDDYYVRGTVRDFRFIHRDPTLALDGHSVDRSEQSWELRPAEESDDERLESEGRVGERTERQDREEWDEREEVTERLGREEYDEESQRQTLTRYASGGRVAQRRLFRGPSGEWER